MTKKLTKAVIAAGLDEGRLITVDLITFECFVHPNLAKIALSGDLSRKSP